MTFQQLLSSAYYFFCLLLLRCCPVQFTEVPQTFSAAQQRRVAGGGVKKLLQILLWTTLFYKNGNLNIHQSAFHSYLSQLSPGPPECPLISLMLGLCFLICPNTQQNQSNLFGNSSASKSVKWGGRWWGTEGKV